MIDELRQQLQESIEEVISARFDFEIPDFTSGPVELNASLVQVQFVLTELEKQLSKALRAKAVLDRRVSHLRMVWQEAFDTALIKPKKVSFGSEFVTGKEKASDANLASFEEARALRHMEEHASFANEAVDVIRLHYYGLDKVRQDLRKRLDMSQTDYYSAS